MAAACCGGVTSGTSAGPAHADRAASARASQERDVSLGPPRSRTDWARETVSMIATAQKSKGQLVDLGLWDLRFEGGAGSGGSTGGRARHGGNSSDGGGFEKPEKKKP